MSADAATSAGVEPASAPDSANSCRKGMEREEEEEVVAEEVEVAEEKEAEKEW